MKVLGSHQGLPSGGGATMTPTAPEAMALTHSQLLALSCGKMHCVMIPEITSRCSQEANVFVCTSPSCGVKMLKAHVLLRGMGAESQSCSVLFAQKTRELNSCLSKCTAFSRAPCALLRQHGWSPQRQTKSNFWAPKAAVAMAKEDGGGPSVPGST